MSYLCVMNRSLFAPDCVGVDETSVKDVEYERRGLAFLLFTLSVKVVASSKQIPAARA